MAVSIGTVTKLLSGDSSWLLEITYNRDVHPPIISMLNFYSYYAKIYAAMTYLKRKAFVVDLKKVKELKHLLGSRSESEAVREAISLVIEAERLGRAMNHIGKRILKSTSREKKSK